MTNFTKEYWDHNYSEPKTMDCIGNADEHVAYIWSILDLEKIDISSVIDLGTGHGIFFKKILKQLIPYKAHAIEPSSFIFKTLDKNKLRPVESTKLTLKNESIQDWISRKGRGSYDLALCTSVFQYIDNIELEGIIEELSKRVKFLYLTVPTNKELVRQREDLEFDDTYAYSRSKSFYHKLMKKHFTCVSSRFWESKYFFDEESTHFSDLLYRF